KHRHYRAALIAAVYAPALPQDNMRSDTQQHGVEQVQPANTLKHKKSPETAAANYFATAAKPTQQNDTAGHAVQCRQQLAPLQPTRQWLAIIGNKLHR